MGDTPRGRRTGGLPTSILSDPGVCPSRTPPKPPWAEARRDARARNRFVVDGGASRRVAVVGPRGASFRLQNPARKASAPLSGPHPPPSPCSQWTLLAVHRALSEALRGQGPPVAPAQDGASGNSRVPPRRDGPARVRPVTHFVRALAAGGPAAPIEYEIGIAEKRYGSTDRARAEFTRALGEQAGPGAARSSRARGRGGTVRRRRAQLTRYIAAAGPDRGAPLLSVSRQTAAERRRRGEHRAGAGARRRFVAERRGGGARPGASGRRSGMRRRPARARGTRRSRGPFRSPRRPRLPPDHATDPRGSAFLKRTAFGFALNPARLAPESGVPGSHTIAPAEPFPP